MPSRVKVSSLTLKDALDLASLIEFEAFKRYSSFAEQLGYRDDNDAASWFRAMAANEKKHGQQLAHRRQALFGDAPAVVTLDDLFDVEAPEQGSIRRNMSKLQALQLALSAEKKAHAFYEEALPTVADRDVRQLFEELRDEETEHIRMVSEAISGLPPGASLSHEDEDELE